MVAERGRIQGLWWRYDGVVIGSDPGSFRWVEMGIFNLCGSVKKRNPQKIRKEVLEDGDMEAVGCETAWGCCGRWYDSIYEDRSGFGYLGDTVKKRSPEEWRIRDDFWNVSNF
jgi:hypothetical protein